MPTDINFEFPVFKVDGTQFQILAREGVVGSEVVVVVDEGDAGWGGLPDDRSIIVPELTEEVIMQERPGFGAGRRAFLSFIKAEAMVRAKRHMREMKPPPPNYVTNKVENTIWNMKYSMHSRPDGSDIDIDAGPLP